MKKILSLCLVVVMLLGMLSMTASAVEVEPGTEHWVEFSLLLDSGVSMKFVFDGLDSSESYQIKFTTDNVDLPVQIVDAKPVEGADGQFYATYTNLNPKYFDAKITAEVVDAGEGYKSEPRSVMDYCQKVLADPKYSDEVHAIAADLMNYTAAVNTWLADQNGSPEGVEYLGRELTEEEIKGIATITPDSYTGSFSFPSIANLVCKKLGITYTSALAPKTFYTTLFDGSKNARTTLKDRSEIAEDDRMLYDMIVPNSWGGIYFTEDNRNSLSADMFKPGDMVLVRGKESTTAPYWGFIFVGNGVFVGWTSANKAHRSYITMNNFLNKYLAGEGYEGNKALTQDGDEVTVGTDEIGAYAIFRPSQVLPNYNVVESDGLTVGGVDYGFMGTVATPNVLNTITNEAQTGKTVQFGDAMPILGVSIGYRFYIDTENSNLDGVTFKGQIEGGGPIDLTRKVNKNGTYVDFDALTPADLSKTVTIWAEDTTGTKVSIEMKISGAAYTAAILYGDYSGNLKNLVSAMMVYSQGVENYVESGCKKLYTYNTTISGDDKPVVSTSGTVTVGAFTNYEVLKYRIMNMPTDHLVGTRGHAKYVFSSVYATVGAKVSNIFDEATSSKVEEQTEVVGSNAYICRIDFKTTDDDADTIGDYDLLAQLQPGDVIVASVSTAAEWVTTDNLPNTNTNYVYLGNGKFARGSTGGNTSVEIVDVSVFDNHATEGVTEDILDFGSYSRIFIIRPSNLYKGN